MGKRPVCRKNPFDPERWGIPSEAVENLAGDLARFWRRFRRCFRTRTRDASQRAYKYLRGKLTMEDRRNFAHIEECLTGGDGQALQQFISDSPWSAASVFRQIQGEIRAHPALASGGALILDESADERAGPESAGSARQYNGRQGKVDQCHVAVGLGYAHLPTGTWALVDSELYLPEGWFTDAYAERREKVGIPPERKFATKPELGLALIQRAHGQGLPFEYVACDEPYGQSREFRAALGRQGIPYAAQVPSDTLVYRAAPRVGIPPGPHRGRRPTKVRVLSPGRPCQVRQIARSRRTVWESAEIRDTERGVLKADFAALRVWTLTEAMDVRAEWLVIRRDADGTIRFTLLHAPPDTPVRVLIQRACVRYFMERVFQDAKSEMGWDEFQARKYRAWQHESALTAAALWFVAEVKLRWRRDQARDPELARQFELRVLPALSTRNVREMLRAVLPLPRLTAQQAREQVTRHLVHRARSTRSRLKAQRAHRDTS